eukprot:NODE_238_length_1951_cov_208.596215_g188_i0.p1 GENE.NODE_238_length_1951_cov_208.596215_g188_i0~~NODE_238_length_1951_cov_208.596215_g188_i0.p1  ORF type:complete len:591 (+),score=142.40 NODE_238_length_1951_cov_208.596215_g188_i0:94-1866(+)
MSIFPTTMSPVHIEVPAEGFLEPTRVPPTNTNNTRCIRIGRGIGISTGTTAKKERTGGEGGGGEGSQETQAQVAPFEEALTGSMEVATRGHLRLATLYAEQKEELQQLWDELRVPADERRSAVDLDTPPSEKGIYRIQVELRRRQVELDTFGAVRRSIPFREQAVENLHQFVRRFENGEMAYAAVDDVRLQATALLEEVQRTTAQTRQSLGHWRRAISKGLIDPNKGQHTKIDENGDPLFLWNRINYNHKMEYDLSFLALSAIKFLLPSALTSLIKVDPFETHPMPKMRHHQHHNTNHYQRPSHLHSHSHSSSSHITRSTSPLPAEPFHSHSHSRSRPASPSPSSLPGSPGGGGHFFTAAGAGASRGSHVSVRSGSSPSRPHTLPTTLRPATANSKSKLLNTHHRMNSATHSAAAAEGPLRLPRPKSADVRGVAGANRQQLSRNAAVSEIAGGRSGGGGGASMPNVRTKGRRRPHSALHNRTTTRLPDHPDQPLVDASTSSAVPVSVSADPVPVTPAPHWGTLTPSVVDMDAPLSVHRTQPSSPSSFSLPSQSASAPAFDWPTDSLVGSEIEWFLSAGTSTTQPKISLHS